MRYDVTLNIYDCCYGTPEKIAEQSYHHIPNSGDKIKIKTNNCIKVFIVRHRIYDVNGLVEGLMV